MSVAIVVLSIVVGIAVVVAGGALMMRSREVVEPEPPPPELPEPVVQTDEAGRKRIVERAVYLALELARVDGAIADTEMQAIEDHLARNIVDMDSRQAEMVVRQILRATIRQTEASFAVQEILELADDEHRKFVVELLAFVAAADGTVNDAERAFAEPIAHKLGLVFKG